MSWRDASPHVVYRFYDGAGTLLYVGLSSDFGARATEHSRMKAWWGDVATIGVEHYSDCASATARETEIIRDLRPPQNLRSNPNNPLRVLDAEERARRLARRTRRDRVTQCPRGHPYNEENTYITLRGWRQCRICKRAQCG